jgi:monofunctional biosynthetic peptidoglycan transglycosylase
MQTAKNVFLPHSRNMVRKAFEAYFTVMIEAIWDKKRIIEVYANIVELGDALWRRSCFTKYFNKRHHIDKRRSSFAGCGSTESSPLVCRRAF